MSDILHDAQAISDQIITLRHAIHAEPEIGLHLPRTQQKVLAALDGLPLEVSTGTALSSVTAVLRGGRPGPTVLLRGDMDALPVTERSGVDYASQVPGAMHACGHDLHTSMLAGAARLLAERQADLPGNVIFMFQPGEEGDGGARLMIEEGLLTAAGERPVAAFALHVESGLLPLGVVATRAGTAMAAADTLHVTVRGRGGHGSQPHGAADPIPAACEIVTALQTMVTRRFDVFDPVVLTVGTFHAGTKDNIIPDDAAFIATVRTFSAAARDQIRDLSLGLVRQIAQAHGLSAEAEYVDGYPVTANDQREFAFTERTVTDLFGPGRFLDAPNPITGSEDFSYVLQEVPGTFMMIGACPPATDPAAAPFNHSPEAVFDDAIVPDGMALYAELALRRLAAGA
ncbi:MAG: M20 metallopeptidase family protein [Streptosporangiaceae bacterium]